MAKRPSNKRNRLSDDIDSRLIPYIQQIQQENTSGSVSAHTVFQYVQKVDFSFKRMKKAQLEQSIDRVLKSLKKQDIGKQVDDLSSYKTELNKEIRSEFSEPSDLDDSEAMEFERLKIEGVQMMEVKDTNLMNKSITKIWSQHQPQSAESSPKHTPSANSNSNIILASSSPIVGKNQYEKEKFNIKRKSRIKVSKTESKNLTSKEVKNDLSLPSARLSDLGGVDACIEEVLELIAMPLIHPEIYLHTGVQPPRGILLHGPPGCGKTLLANAIAGELDVPFISISAPSVVSGMSGESEKKIREMFEEAKEKAPCLIFIDEIDAITPKRETAQREMERRIVAQLLTCMDDLSWDKMNYQPILIIGATNRPDSLDPALRRAGRFDREISMGVPDEQAREKILRVISSKLKLSGDFDYKTLAKLTPGYVGADLNALTTAAGVIAVKRIFTHLNDRHKFDVDNDNSIEMQVDNISSSTSFEEQSPSDKLKSISAFFRNHPDPLTEEELEPLSITNDDFLQALSKVQPSSKREGFATVPDVTWADIGALKFVRDELRMAIVEPIKHPEFFSKVGITAPAGVLLWGPPGCGKTLLAKAIANESHINFISVKGPELLNKYVGESERGIRQVFARARASSPCVIFFDELDALCSRRDDSQSEASARVVNTLLAELDGLENRKQVYVIAATNRPDIIDSAMMRPGRLDKLLYVELPTPSGRHEILKTLTKRTPLGDDVSLIKIAEDERCTDFSGADLASLIREAAVAALRTTLYSQDDNLSIINKLPNNEIYVNNSHFETAFNKVSPSVSKSDKKRYESLRIKLGCTTENKIADKSNNND
ncbi:P-loop containing nucleoside triphosphate hydrolase protein [Glomus cerebriforme]|uniref:P-loop containing nucleoside triphosphate hydrolase protein n=1 Tax=Glomus cerebriforme TaxID=658196 RepID=A0A397TS93_9GLOM|nr:P-loop containing nucleoside triphosphate hydrolase protein [Glomus cerebriforme]